MAPWYAFPHADHDREVQMGAEYRPVPIQKKIAAAPVQINDPKYPMSHARPVPGGFSGRLEFDLIAETPVLFGMARDQAGAHQTPITEHVCLDEGEDAPFAAPGRAIKGMIRSVFGIATFSAFKPVNGDHRFFSRNRYYLAQFANEGRLAPKPAWLRPNLSADRKSIQWEISTCSSNQLPITDLAPYLPLPEITNKLPKKDDNKSDAYRLLNGSELEKARSSFVKTCRNIEIKGDIRAAEPNISAQDLRNQTGARYDTTYIFPNPVPVVTSSETVFAAWNMLPLEAKHKVLNEVARLNPALTIGGSTIVGPARDRYLVTAGTMATRENETLFALPVNNFIRVDPTAMASFLMANSKYANGGATYPVGGKRKPDGNFLCLLCEYLFALGQNYALPIAGLLGLDWREVERNALRRDNPPGIPVHVHGDPTDAGFEIGTSKLVPKGPRTSVVGLLTKQQPPLEDGVLDWADALFGEVDESDKKTPKPFAAIASRLDFDFAHVVNPVPPGGHECLPRHLAIRVLQGLPKGSFDPFMLARKNANGASAGWAGENSEIAGYKRYPACMDVDPAFLAGSVEHFRHTVVVRGADGAPLGESVSISDVGAMVSLVRPLKAGTHYRAGVDFHNLHPLELGALLWALSFGDARVFTDNGEKTCYRHVGGRLRAKGLGRLRPANAQLVEIERNPLPDELCAADADPKGLVINLMTAFEIAMGRLLASNSDLDSSEARKKFYGCETIRALLNLSDAAWSNLPDVINGLHGGNANRGIGGMFRTPGGHPNKPGFKNFAAIRRNIYNKTPGFLPTGQKSILSEFLDPPAKVPERGEQGLECLLDPARELEAWRARAASQG